YFSLQVISARRAFRVSPPITTGPPEFERIYRAQCGGSVWPGIPVRAPPLLSGLREICAAKTEDAGWAELELRRSLLEDGGGCSPPSQSLIKA
ncbi:hypothetical protein E2I00_018393, partial [Balaenoptera physalus]